MDDEMRDYSVGTKVSFHLTLDSSEFNSLIMHSVRQSFAEHVRDVFNGDHDLADHVAGTLDFQFRGRDGEFQYVFTCCDESKTEAESFSEFCVRGVQEELEAFGYKIKGISCEAEEMGTEWLDKLEDAVFGPPKPVAERNLPDTGTRKPLVRAGKKRTGTER